MASGVFCRICSTASPTRRRGNSAAWPMASANATPAGEPSSRRSAMRCLIRSAPLPKMMWTRRILPAITRATMPVASPIRKEDTMLTNDEKAKLAEVYEPILLMHRDEKYEPISPAGYMTGCAMWVNKPVGTERRHWGDGGHELDDEFPREPLIQQSKLGVDMMTAAADGDVFIGSEEEDGFRT